jgi:hypothetical protein
VVVEIFEYLHHILKLSMNLSECRASDMSIKLEYYFTSLRQITQWILYLSYTIDKNNSSDNHTYKNKAAFSSLSLTFVKSIQRESMNGRVDKTQQSTRLMRWLSKLPM